MLRLSFALCVVALAALPATGQEAKETPYSMPAPRGWGKETIKLPPPFAPDMKWKGVEELRFAPGMFKADSDSFLSYAVLFWLPADEKTDIKSVERELLAYYRGLGKAVSEGRKREVDVTAFKLKLEESKTEKPARRPGGEACSAFAGELKWVEPFVTGKAQTLRLEVQSWTCAKAGRRCLFVCASPQPEGAAVWKSLHEIRDGTRCSPAKP